MGAKLVGGLGRLLGASRFEGRVDGSLVAAGSRGVEVINTSGISHDGSPLHSTPRRDVGVLGEVTLLAGRVVHQQNGPHST